MTSFSPDRRARVAVLISGRGSNMAALTAASRAPDAPFAIALALSDNPAAPGLARASEAGIATDVVSAGAISGDKAARRAAFEAAVDARLRDAGIDVVCLAGFMRVLSPRLIAPWRGRILNIHPSLLPAFPGLDTHARALAAGVALHGATVHLVDETLDGGPILAQAALRVGKGETPEGLAARVLALEHRLYPATLARWARGDDAPPPGDGDALFAPPLA